MGARLLGANPMTPAARQLRQRAKLKPLPGPWRPREVPTNAGKRGEPGKVKAHPIGKDIDTKR
jgi:hypothetical protein